MLKASHRGRMIGNHATRDDYIAMFGQHVEYPCPDLILADEPVRPLLEPKENPPLVAFNDFRNTSRDDHRPFVFGKLQL